MVTRVVTKLLVGVAALLVVLLAAALLIDEPLRAYVEQKMNRSLKGYRVHIGALDFHPDRSFTGSARHPTRAYG